MTHQKKHIHFIAIGGSAMHNLAISINNSGYKVTGSDDDIFEPSHTRLKKNGLLPEKYGWYPDKISKQTESVILGMHAREDNPELMRAKVLGIPIYSFPEYVYKASKNAVRVVIAGSHGKSTITSMILHVLKFYKLEFDYLVGAGLEGFDNMVKLTGAPLIILEGDEYLTSTLDRTPKFLRYNHHIGLITGIAWDHINAFPTKALYIEQFSKFIDNTPAEGKIVYNKEDATLSQLFHNKDLNFELIGYETPEYEIHNDFCLYNLNNNKYEINVFGRHNMQNISGALKVLECLDIDTHKSLRALQNFKGASNRLESLYEDKNLKIFKDFAHSPSKLKATTEAVKERFPGMKIINCYELHTYSSLNKDFLDEYKGTLSKEGTNIIFINEHTLKIKKMPPISDEEIKNCFDNQQLMIVRKVEEMKRLILHYVEDRTVLLLMSSGNFGDINYPDLIAQLKK